MSDSDNKISLKAFREERTKNSGDMTACIDVNETPTDTQIRTSLLKDSKQYLAALTADFAAKSSLVQDWSFVENKGERVGVKLTFNLVSADKKKTATLEIEAKPDNYQQSPDKWGDVTFMDVTGTKYLPGWFGTQKKDRSDRQYNEKTKSEAYIQNKLLNGWLKAACKHTGVTPPPQSSAVMGQAAPSRELT